MGIEPMSLPWQGRILPLNHIRLSKSLCLQYIFIIHFFDEIDYNTFDFIKCTIRPVDPAQKNPGKRVELS